MTAIEIVLLIGGALIFAAGFIIPEKKRSSDTANERLLGMKVNRLIDDRTEDIRNEIRRAADDSMEESVLQGKRELERVTNEKIMAVDDYSKVVLGDIEKNHKEAVFLFEMLENKSLDLKNTMRKAEHIRTSVESSLPAEKRPPEQPARARKEAAPERAPDGKVMSGMERIQGKGTGKRKPQKASAPEEGARSERQNKLKAPEEPEKPEVEVDRTNGNRNDRVLELHKQGLSNVEVAKELNMGVGEVNLIIDLFEAAGGQEVVR